MTFESKPVTASALYLVAMAAEHPDAVSVLHGVLREIENGVSPDQFWSDYRTGKEVNWRIGAAVRRATVEAAPAETAVED